MKTVDSYVGCWSDYDARHLASDLKAAGVRAKTTDSPYVGHRTLKVHVDDLEKVRKLLPQLDPENGQYIADECLCNPTIF